MDSCLSQLDWCVMKREQPRPCFELGSPIPFLKMITVMLSVPSQVSYIFKATLLVNNVAMKDVFTVGAVIMSVLVVEY